MGAVVGPIVLGVLISILGVFNMSGNISSIHWYHRQRVTEENRKPFGKMIGLGTLLIGAALILFGGFSFVAEKMQNDIFITIGSIMMVAACVAGLGLSFYAMFKYNKGIF